MNEGKFSSFVGRFWVFMLSFWKKAMTWGFDSGKTSIFIPITVNVVLIGGTILSGIIKNLSIWIILLELLLILCANLIGILSAYYFKTRWEEYKDKKILYGQARVPDKKGKGGK